MATDNTPPKVSNIIKVGALAIAVLIGIRLGLVSYFHHVADEERHLKYIDMAQSRGLQELRTDEQKQLANVQTTMDMIASKGRMEPGIEPKQVDYQGAKDTLNGWMQMPRTVDSAVMAPPAPSSAPAPAASGDGGAMSADGGAAPATSASAVPAGSSSATSTGSSQVPPPVPSASAPKPQGSAHP